MAYPSWNGMARKGALTRRGTGESGRYGYVWHGEVWHGGLMRIFVPRYGDANRVRELDTMAR